MSTMADKLKAAEEKKAEELKKAASENNKIAPGTLTGTAKVTVAAYENVKGGTNLYCIIQMDNKEEKVIINIGSSNYEALKKLIGGL